MSKVRSVLVCCFSVLLTSLLFASSNLLYLAAASADEFDRRTESSLSDDFDLRGGRGDCEERIFATCRSNCQVELPDELADFRCLRDCVARECPARELWGFNRPTSGEDCLLENSERCDSACIGMGYTGPARARCRRDCLNERCGSSAQVFDLAKEAQQPGYVRCERCKRDAEELCREVCIMSSGGRGFAGCRISCHRFRCFRECGASPPSGSVVQEDNW